jgi:cell division protein FtsB
MSSIKLFSKKNILKIFLITISIFFWSLFFALSNISLESIIIFDIPTIINTYFTTNFLIFLIAFPITTAIIVSLAITNKNTKENIKITSFSIVLAMLLSYFIFDFNLIFLLFTLFYLILHILIIYITRSKVNSEKKKSIINIGSFAGSKVALFLTIILFILVVIYLYPNQQDQALRMEAGVVNLFVGDDLSNWFGTSYSISASCTNQNLDFIMSRNEFKDLEKNNNNEDVINFVNFVKDYKQDISEPKTNSEIIENFPDLSSIEIKENVIETLRDMPLINIIENYFAIIFAFILVSFLYLYFGIAFGFLGVLFIYLFYLLFKNKNEEDKYKNYKQENVKKEIKVSNLQNKENLQNHKDLEDNKDQKKESNRKEDNEVDEDIDEKDFDSLDFSQKKASRPRS